MLFRQTTHKIHCRQTVAVDEWTKERTTLMRKIRWRRRWVTSTTTAAMMAKESDTNDNAGNIEHNIMRGHRTKRGEAESLDGKFGRALSIFELYSSILLSQKPSLRRSNLIQFDSFPYVCASSHANSLLTHPHRRTPKRTSEMVDWRRNSSSQLIDQSETNKPKNGTTSIKLLRVHPSQHPTHACDSQQSTWIAFVCRYCRQWQRFTRTAALIVCVCVCVCVSKIGGDEGHII